MDTSRRKAFFFIILTAISSFPTLQVYGIGGTSPHHQRKIKSLSTPHLTTPCEGDKTSSTPVVYHVSSYGADPTGRTDSTDSIITALQDALKGPGNGFLMNGIVNLGGARMDLDGGMYLISRPIQFPVTGRGNLVIHGGSLKASDNFPNEGYLIDLSPVVESASDYNFEFVTLRDLMLDSNFRGGGIQVVNSLRTNIDNCYITHFNTTGISVKGGHETSIRHSYIGQHITAGGDPDEKNFSGIGIELSGNDNSVTNVVIFSAAIGMLISGQANIISGVHCYNKATGFGGTGIYLKIPGLTQTRIVDSYLDYTGIVAEDPVQLTISNSFFLGDANIVLKSLKGVVNGVDIVDNMFTGNNNGIEIVRLDGTFKDVDQIVIDRNSVRGMKLKATVGRASVEGKGKLWMADFNSVLLFPDLVRHVYYTLINKDGTTSFPIHSLTNVSNNTIVVRSEATVEARVYITVDQG